MQKLAEPGGTAISSDATQPKDHGELSAAATLRAPEWKALEQRLAATGLVLGIVRQKEGLDPAVASFVAGAPVSQSVSPVLDITLSSALTTIDPYHRRVLEGRLYHVVDLVGRHLASYARKTPFKLTFHIGDGGGPAALCFDRPIGSDWSLIPDLYLLAATPAELSPGFEQRFGERKPVLFWRGSTTGGSYSSREDLLASYRVATCLRLRDALGERADCRISGVVQLRGYPAQDAMDTLTEMGVYGDYVAESRFAEYQMFLNLPGNTAAWGSCLKYLAGCLVFRPPSGRELYYSHLLEPWRHYVPIAADMSDIAERMTWVSANLLEASAIAERGQTLMSDVVHRIPELMRELFEQHNQFGVDENGDD